MAQHDMVIENAPGLGFRDDVNAALLALITQSSGAIEPTVMYPGQLWLDTSIAPNGALRQRNLANSAWISLPVAGAVLYDAVQALSVAQKLQAQNNIDSNRAVFAAKAGNYAALVSDTGVALIFSAAATLSLAAAAVLKTGWYCTVVALAGDVLVDPNAAELIDGVATVTVRSGQSCMIFCDGTKFVTNRTQNRSWEMVGAPVAIAAAQPSIIWTDLGVYRRIRVSGFMRPTNANVAILGNVSADNGATWVAGASDYFTQVVNGAAGVAGAGQVTGTSLYLHAGTIGNASNQGLRVQFELDDFNKALPSWGNELSYQIGSTVVVTAAGITTAASQALNALRLIPAAGTFANGFMTMEGIRG